MNPGYEVWLAKDEDGIWIAFHPQLHGCIAHGETPQAAIESLEVSRELWLESVTAAGRPIPSPASKPADAGSVGARALAHLRAVAAAAEPHGEDGICISDVEFALLDVNGFLYGLDN